MTVCCLRSKKWQLPLCAAISLLLALGKIVAAVDVPSQLLVVEIRLHHCLASVADVNANIAILKWLHV